MSSSSVKKLKAEISSLASLFPRDHNRVRIVSSGCDEVVIHFLDGRKKLVVICSGLENYLDGKPVWYSESEDSFIVSALEEVDDSNLKTVSGMMHVLLSSICVARQLPLLPELSQLAELSLGLGGDVSSRDGQSTEPGAQATYSSPLSIQSSVDADDEDIEMSEMDDDENDDFGVAEHFANVPDSDAATGVDSGCDMDAGDKAVLEKVKKTAMSEYASGKPVGASVRSTDRLMKELKELFKSESVRTGVFSVSLVAECLYEWRVQLHKFDTDSKLHRDLERYAKKTNEKYIELNIHFTKEFPVTPPFVRVVKPIIEGGFVMSGGAICMELLTSDGWSVVYSLEGVILQIMATMVKGQARIYSEKSAHGSYSLHRAQTSFKMLTETHAKKGWFTPPQKDG